MSNFQQKFTIYKKAKKQFEETEQASEADSDMAKMLEFSDWEFKTTTINKYIKGSKGKSRQHAKTEG